MRIAESELILNKDGSIYHLNLLPEHIANTVITVGDPDRVSQVTSYFDEIEFTIRKREFFTQTGYYQGERLTVISTGIGTDNIDIVLNELDALVNIDFTQRTIKKEATALNIIRIGTTGAIQKHIAVDSFIASEIGIGFDNLLHFYQSDDIQDLKLASDLGKYLTWDAAKAPYAVHWDENLGAHFVDKNVHKGITMTNAGFYGPQGRVLRAPLKDTNLNHKIEAYSYKDKLITNLEMETAGIYGLAKLLGHKAISMNVVLANRPLGKFSTDPKEAVDRLIRFCLEKIASYPH
ncbi:nucleoside phosphorylase [Aquimarina brevivitae]|uniref:Uridine phosphorylase n=1 Tax=Aquimarina brevivitae TaxID=323412 RepID=A0A4V2F4V7_9FLAO|nr:nucleoside phosphorylase [Aquimarina brevivitae]RZS90659.1 uridine phosphorylase [Aquimarina brevivitae]